MMSPSNGRECDDMKDKVSVILGKATYRMMFGSEYDGDRKTYNRIVSILNEHFSGATMYKVSDRECYLCPDRLYGAFVLRDDRLSGSDHFAAAYVQHFQPGAFERGRKVGIVWLRALKKFMKRIDDE